MQSGVVLLGSVLACVILAYFVAQANSDGALTLAGFSRLMVVLLTVAVIIRWESRSQIAFYATAAVTVLGLFATSTSVFIVNGSRPLTANCSLAMLTLLWTTAEIAIHFQSIDVEILRRDPAIANQRRQQNAGVLKFFAVVMGIALSFALWSSMRLVAVPIIASLGAAIAYWSVIGVAKYPARFLSLAIKHYVGYPESSSLAPGLIRSSAASPLFRLLPIVVAVVASALIAIPDQSTAKVSVEPALMAMCGVLVGITALMLGASLSARPIHFDVDRTPFDVVVTKLRPVENKNG